MNFGKQKISTYAIIVGVFLFVFAVSFTILYVFNFVPTELQNEDITDVPFNVASTTAVGKKQVELPVKIVIDKIGVNSIIQNPDTTNIYALDDLLLHGAVRYPGSGTPGQGNMFLFAHSTSFKVVHNQAYKTFDNLKDLQAGDVITVYSETKKYNYTVTKVSLVHSQDAIIDISTSKNMITLSSCNTLGAKEDRYLVEGSFTGSVKI